MKKRRWKSRVGGEGGGGCGVEEGLEGVGGGGGVGRGGVGATNNQIKRGLEHRYLRRLVASPKKFIFRGLSNCGHNKRYSVRIA